MFNIVGLSGAFLGGYAYLPQIHHLIVEKCSAGISIRAFSIWMISSALVLANAIYLGTLVFIVLGTIQFLATATILTLTIRNKGHVCETHIQGVK